MRPILITIASALLLAAATASCSSSNASTASGNAISVTASFYPLVYAAQRIGGSCVDVTNLTPPGVEPHDLELTPSDIGSIADADVVLYLGGGFQPAVEAAVDEAQGTTLDVLSSVDTRAAPPSVADEGMSVDPHVWLDPGLFATVIPAIAHALEEAAPHASCDLDANARATIDELHTLDTGFTQGLSNCERTTIVTNHAAFGYLAAAYGLTQQAISGLEPDAEPTPDRIAELKDLVQRQGITTIFSEELVSPKVAETLANEAGVHVVVLATLEGVSQDELDAGQDYRSIMRSDLRTLRTALGCS